jgi:hypothetical protein
MACRARFSSGWPLSGQDESKENTAQRWNDPGVRQMQEGEHHSRSYLRFFAFGFVGPPSAARQKSSTCFVEAAASFETSVASRLIAAAACPRAAPVTLFAPLSHMLMNGFFLSHRFFIRRRAPVCNGFSGVCVGNG